MLMMHPIDAMMTDAFHAKAFPVHPIEALLGARSCRLATCTPRAHETEDGKYAFAVEAPGVKMTDVTIESHADPCRVTVKGETVTNSHTHFVNYSVRLPDDADVEAATAEHADGLITVSVPKKAPAVPEKILVVVNAVDDEDTPDEDEEARPYKLTIAATGISPADLELVVEDGTLTVRGASKRSGGAKIDRAYRLPRDADAAKATATHVDGLLTVSVPKKPEVEARKITVNAPVAHKAEAEAAAPIADEDAVMV